MTKYGIKRACIALAVLFAVGFVLFRVSCRTEDAKQV